MKMVQFTRSAICTPLFLLLYFSFTNAMEKGYFSGSENHDSATRFLMLKSSDKMLTRNISDSTTVVSLKAEVKAIEKSRPPTSKSKQAPDMTPVKTESATGEKTKLNSASANATLTNKDSVIKEDASVNKVNNNNRIDNGVKPLISSSNASFVLPLTTPVDELMNKASNSSHHVAVANVSSTEVAGIIDNASLPLVESKPKLQEKSLDSLPPFNSLVSPTSQVDVVPKPKETPPEFQFIHECGCRRNFFYGFEGFSNSKLNSSCSDEGTHYQPGQKVVSFSLPRATSPGDYNRTGSYKVNVIENLNRIRHFYPGYSMRLYTDLSLDSTYCRFLCQNIDLFWCDIRNSVVGDQSKMLHPTWKFLPLGDPSVELFLSRDISNFINEREAAVVEDWLKLGKAFHLMRDNKRRHNIAMIGGLWGARNDLLLGDEGDKLRTLIISMSKTPRNKGYRAKNFDQDILSRVIFYPRKKDIVAYDSYHCRQWRKFTMVRPFPVKRNNTLVVQEFAIRGRTSAAVAAIKKKIKLIKCPVECRPSYGKDWEYC